MPRIIKSNSSNRFKGNMYVKGTSVNLNPEIDLQSTPSTNETSPIEPKQSSSSKKISQSKLPKNYEYESNDVNAIFNLPMLSRLVKVFTECQDEIDCISLALDENYTNGLAHRIIIKCDQCQMEEACINYNIIRNLHEVNMRFAYA